MIKYDVSRGWSGAAPPAQPLPWVTLTFDDGGGTGSVTLKIQSSLSTGEFIDEVLINFDDTLDLFSLGISQSATDTAPAANFVWSENNLQADGDGKFDIKFVFPSGPPARRVGGGQ